MYTGTGVVSDGFRICCLQPSIHFKYMLWSSSNLYCSQFAADPKGMREASKLKAALRYALNLR